jgi:hypothetical protein
MFSNDLQMVECTKKNTLEQDHLEEIAKYVETISLQQQNIEELELRLKKYTNGENHKRYYEKNKNKIKESGSNYLQKLKTENPEKIKEYSRTAYANKKAKKNLEKINN